MAGRETINQSSGECEAYEKVVFRNSLAGLLGFEI